MVVGLSLIIPMPGKKVKGQSLVDHCLGITPPAPSPLLFFFSLSVIPHIQPSKLDHKALFEKVTERMID